jgi:hypothetical protein
MYAVDSISELNCIITGINTWAHTHAYIRGGDGKWRCDTETNRQTGTHHPHTLTHHMHTNTHIQRHRHNSSSAGGGCGAVAVGMRSGIES